MKIAIAILLGGIIVVGLASWYAGRTARRYLVQSIEAHYHSKVEIKSFEVLVFPRIVIRGEGLVLRNNPDASAPPFIQISSFTADTGILDLLRKKKRIRMLTLSGLEINIVHNDQSQPENPQNSGNSHVPDFVIAEVQADETKLVIHPRDPGRESRTWEIHQLSLHSAGTGDNMSYKATLTNPTPPGKIESSGYFLLNVDDPGKSPLKGDYQFRHADLSHFNGIAGILSSDGSFSGVLDRIDVKGKTDIPDFEVRRSGHPVHLTTEFVAVVDGTDGDTELHEVRASFLHTQLVAQGKIEGTSGRKGKTITLKVDSEQARVEDLISLVVPQDPPLSGSAQFHTAFELPPGDNDVINRLRLNGSFGLEQAKFSKNDIQQKVAKLSARAQGNKSDTINADNTAANFQGHFMLNSGVASFSQLSFDVPGASVNLHGSYNLNQEALDFRGHLHLQAKLSEMTTGVKSFFAKLVQPLFNGEKGKGQTDIPIKITGTREKPKFGLDAGAVLH